jgi:hypothetical protein
MSRLVGGPFGSRWLVPLYPFQARTPLFASSLPRLVRLRSSVRVFTLATSQVAGSLFAFRNKVHFSKTQRKLYVNYPSLPGRTLPTHSWIVFVATFSDGNDGES